MYKANMLRKKSNPMGCAVSRISHIFIMFLEHSVADSKSAVGEGAVVAAAATDPESEATIGWNNFWTRSETIKRVAW